MLVGLFVGSLFRWFVGSLVRWFVGSLIAVVTPGQRSKKQNAGRLDATLRLSTSPPSQLGEKPGLERASSVCNSLHMSCETFRVGRLYIPP